MKEREKDPEGGTVDRHKGNAAHFPAESGNGESKTTTRYAQRSVTVTSRLSKNISWPTKKWRATLGSSARKKNELVIAFESRPAGSARNKEVWPEPDGEALWTVDANKEPKRTEYSAIGSYLLLTFPRKRAYASRVGPLLVICGKIESDRSFLIQTASPNCWHPEISLTKTDILIGRVN